MLLFGKALGNGIHIGAALMKNICWKGLAASIEVINQEVYETVMPKLKESGLLVGPAANNKIVLRPPYVITKEQIDHMVSIFERLL